MGGVHVDARQIQYFLAVAQEKSLSRAAQKLFLTQQGMSKAIRQLEEELDVVLFYRSNAGAELTPHGHAFEKYARPFLHHQDYVLSCMRAQKESLEQELSIGYSTGAFDFLAANFLSDFLTSNPNIKVRVGSYADEHCAQAVLDEKYQLGFLLEPFDRALFEPLYTLNGSLVLMVGQTHPLARRDALKLSDLKGHNVVSINTAAGSQNLIRAACAEAGVTVNLALAPAETRLMAELCEQGVAVCFYAGRTNLYPGSVKAVPIEGFEFEFKLHFVANRNVYQTETTRKFIQYAVERFKQ